jgi:peroxiredoxin Q/BCP
VVVLGVSPDPLAKHAKFIEKHQLPFLLLSDEDHHVAEEYDVWKLKKNFGKEYMGIERTTFLIDEDGNLENVWRKVKVKNHVNEVKQFIMS